MNSLKSPYWQLRPAWQGTEAASDGPKPYTQLNHKDPVSTWKE